MSAPTHRHPCDWKHLGCTNVVECSDENLERNFDGLPEIVCRVVHVQGDRVECADCETGRCEACRCIVRLEGHDEDCARVQAGDVCPHCLTRECAMGPYGHRYSSCADCAGDDPRAGATA